MAYQEYLHLQMRLEGIEIANGDRITRINPDVQDFPLVIYAQTSDEQSFLYFDASLPGELHNQISPADLDDFKPESVIAIFNQMGIPAKSGKYRTYVFPDNFAHAHMQQVKCFDPEDPKVIDFGFGGFEEEVYAVEQNGTIVSACVSSRQNSESAEAWVLTHPEHRRKGYAKQVVSAWASNLKKKGLVPFYSHAFENINSAKLAQRLKLLHVFDETVIDKADPK